MNGSDGNDGKGGIIWKNGELGNMIDFQCVEKNEG